MATELGLFSSTHLQKVAHQSHQNQPSLAAAASAWMWNPKLQAPQVDDDDDDSWEVRAFAEDTGNIMGTTWPPRSYTCTFCRREFRSAQALGGHMNVHRRDRARLHQTHQPHPAAGSSSSSTLIIPTQEFVTNGGGYCLLYQLPHPNGVFTPNLAASCDVNSPSTKFPSISPYPTNNLIRPSANFPSASTSNNNESDIEELDLELRLGHRPKQT